MHVNVNLEEFTIEELYGMVLCGAKQVIINEQELNQLNVFPVADRDTGTNLASMMRYIVDNFSFTNELQELLRQLSQHGLIGCSGNSGLIFSQFFYGLAKHNFTARAYIKLNEFANMLMLGYKSAYSSVSQPKAGTILTVMEMWVNSIANTKAIIASAKSTLSNGKEQLVYAFENSLLLAKDALKNTVNQLDVLRKNNVVDAGAQGFVYFIEGMLLYLKADATTREKLIQDRAMIDTKQFSIGHESQNLTEKPDRQYCFEMVIRTNTDNSGSILESQRKFLEGIGDSLVIGGANCMEKLHIHTNNPTEITRQISQFAEVVYQKADDMLMQYQIANNPIVNRDIAIVVDSTADLPDDWRSQNNVYMIPLQFKVNNSSFLDKIAVNAKDVLRYFSFAGNKISTSAPSSAIVQRVLDFLSCNYKSIIVLPIAKSLSSTYEVIKNQANKITKCDVHVVDLNCSSVALGLLAVHAVELVKLGKYSPSQIIEKLHDVRKNTGFFVYINSVDRLVSSGRVPKFLGYIVKILRVKPMVMFSSSGHPKIIGVAFSRAGGLKKLTSLVSKLVKQDMVKSLAIVYLTAEDVANNFNQDLIKQTKVTPLYMVNPSSVLVAHTGQDGMAIAYSKEQISL